jgi:hypothetical protein
MAYPSVIVKFVDKAGDPTSAMYHLLTPEQTGMTNMYNSAEFYNLAPGTYSLAILDRNYQEGKPITFVVTDTQREFTVIRTDDGNGIALKGQSTSNTDDGASTGNNANSGTSGSGATAPSGPSDTKLRNTIFFINGVAQSFSSKPMQINGTTFVPMRGIFQALQASVNWEPKAQRVNAYRGSNYMNVTIGSKNAMLNGKPYTLLQAPFIQNGTTMVPLRFVSEALGAEVKWDSKTGNIYITDTTITTAS